MTAEAVIASLCQSQAPQLRVPAGLDPAKLLWALAGCESDFGASALPRHEPAYCRGGRYEIRALTRKWGCAAHCSYGPWQMMFGHIVTYNPCAPDEAGPGNFIVAAGDAGIWFQRVAQLSIKATIAMLNAEIFGRQQATTLEEAAKAWNHGNWRDQFDDSAYTDRAARFYATPFPTEDHHAPAH